MNAIGSIFIEAHPQRVWHAVSALIGDDVVTPFDADDPIFPEIDEFDVEVSRLRGTVQLLSYAWPLFDLVSTEPSFVAELSERCGANVRAMAYDERTRSGAFVFAEGGVAARRWFEGDQLGPLKFPDAADKRPMRSLDVRVAEGIASMVQSHRQQAEDTNRQILAVVSVEPLIDRLNAERTLRAERYVIDGDTIVFALPGRPEVRLPANQIWRAGVNPFTKESVVMFRDRQTVTMPRGTDLASLRPFASH